MLDQDNEISEQEQGILQSLAAAEKGAKLGKDMEALLGNRLFKRAIMTAYLENEAIRLVNIKGAPSSMSLDSQAAIMRDIDGIGALRQFIYNTISMGQLLADAIPGHLEELESLRNEEQGE